jgi:hypothetical protein
MANHFYELLSAREELERRSTLKLTSSDIAEVMRVATEKAVGESHEVMAKVEGVLEGDRRFWNYRGDS